jgi:serine/threonine protein kinase
VEKALEQRIAGATIAGKYKIRRVVGAGSMGIVCEAEHLEIGKRLAIKIIDASLAGMKDIAMRFRQEARAASLVESHHIVQVFDAGADEDLGLYLVMEYLTGEDLAARLVREKRLAPDVSVGIALQAARGLAKAHTAGVVHRDLKPANVFLVEREDDEPLVKILDFGISKVIDASRVESKLRLTRAGTVVGTPQYMSPEQARGFSVDARTDVWALGLVLYEMLAGRPAYPELPTYEAFIIHLVSNPPDSLGTVAPWVPTPLARVVHQAIEHDLDARIPSCVELAKRLLEAHPLPGYRGAGLTAAEADTWADESVRSPYADDEPPSSRRVVAEDAPPPEDSLTIDVDVAVEPTPLPPSAAVPRPSPGRLASSGIRTPEDEGTEDFAEDAPQFFDRKSLETFGSPSSAPSSLTASPSSSSTSSSPSSSPSSAPRSDDGSVSGGQAVATRGDRTPAIPAQAVATAERRFPLALMALAFIAVGLVVVVALALR